MAVYVGSQAYAFSQIVNLNPSSVAASTVAAETFAVPGLRADGGPVRVEKRTNDSGLVLMASRISADNELELTFWNTTGGAINAAAQDFYVTQL